MKKEGDSLEGKIVKVPVAILAVTVIFGLIFIMMSFRMSSMQDQINEIVSVIANQGKIMAGLNNAQTAQIVKEIGKLNRAVNNFYGEANTETFMQNDINARMRVVAAGENFKAKTPDAKSVVVLKLAAVPVKNSVVVFTNSGSVYPPYTYQFQKNLVYFTSASSPEEILAGTDPVFFNVKYLPNSFAKDAAIGLEQEELKAILEKGVKAK